MNLQGNQSRLQGLSKELNRAWQETEDQWRDLKRNEFESNYMQPLFDSVENAVAAMNDLEKLLKKIRKDCES